jgi:predicted transcriptional regulator
MEPKYEHHRRLNDIATELRAGETSPMVTVRSFLSWFFSSQRRGHWIVSYIRDCLREAGLSTVPDFESAYLDASMRFQLAEPVAPSSDIIADVAEAVTVADHAEIHIVSAAFADPTYRVSKLAAANTKPVVVRPDTSLTEVVTVLLANDFSQLPVMTSEREVKGIVSWVSIGSRLALNRRVDVARDAMERHAEISSDASLFGVIPLVVEHQYVLVRGGDQRIVGIITTSDVSLQFQQLAEPFVLLGEVENHIRRIIAPRFSPTEITAARDPGDGERQVDSAADLSFGEYGRLLEEPNRWSRLELPIDRTEFIRLLDRVRLIRNDVMHFDPDGILKEDLDVLRDFVRFLRTLQRMGAT